MEQSTYLDQHLGHRIINIAVIDGELYAEDISNNYYFVEDNGYLFSIVTPIKMGECRIYQETRYKKTKLKKPPKDIFYITLPKEYDTGSLYITKDYNNHVNHNIETADWGNYVSPDYDETLILDIGKLHAYTKEETLHFEMIIKDERQESYYYKVDQDFMKHYPGYI